MILGLDPIYFMVLLMMGVIGVIGFMTHVMFRMLKELRGITNENRKLRKFVTAVHRDNMLIARGASHWNDASSDNIRVTDAIGYVHDSRTDITAKLPRLGNTVEAAPAMSRS